MDNINVVEREQRRDIRRRGDTFAEEYVGPECSGWWDAWCGKCGESARESFPSAEDALAWQCGGPGDLA